MPISDIKKDLRERMKSLRAELSGTVSSVSAQICEQVLQSFSWDSEIPLAGFWPMGDEIDIRGVLEKRHQAGQSIGLPVVEKLGRPLIFRSWQPGQQLVEARFGQMEPGEDAVEVMPQVLLVPLLAFDRAGARLGYGAGFYDRTLTALRERGEIQAIGVGYSAQELDHVPVEETDQRLDFIVTEKEVITNPGSGE